MRNEVINLVKKALSNASSDILMSDIIFLKRTIHFPSRYTNCIANGSTVLQASIHADANELAVGGSIFCSYFKYVERARY